MSRLILVLLFVFLACFMVVGCTSSDEPAVEPEPEPLDEEMGAAARTRGVVGGDRSADREPTPQVVLSRMVYEWRTSPDRGLHVTLNFTNPADTYERARGYVFLIAESATVKGVYPWNTKMDGNLPEDHTDGSHVLYRETQQVRAFIPYPRSDGHFETLKLYVFHENGRLLTNRTYELDLTGASGESKTVNPGFDL
ncbi:MAG: hypothetical protein U9Q95_04845 [Candidatus Eisenbacteria bacterium]|nr:hypothetical protein [Candidatus Eisenbacteria bacterium]